jgi:hypothetical protein
MEMKVCKKCKKERRETQFSFRALPGSKERIDICRPCNIGGISAVDRHKILREVYRHYLDLRDFVGRTGHDIIEHPVETEEGSGEYQTLTISFSDLKHGLNELAPRKREAFFFNVILDWKQKDVAEKMGITTVSVGQYVDAAAIQLSKHYFAEVETPLESVHELQGNN